MSIEVISEDSWTRVCARFTPNLFRERIEAFVGSGADILTEIVTLGDALIAGAAVFVESGCYEREATVLIPDAIILVRHRVPAVSASWGLPAMPAHERRVINVTG